MKSFEILTFLELIQRYFKSMEQMNIIDHRINELESVCIKVFLQKFEEPSHLFLEKSLDDFQKNSSEENGVVTSTTSGIILIHLLSIFEHYERVPSRLIANELLKFCEKFLFLFFSHAKEIVIKSELS